MPEDILRAMQIVFYGLAACGAVVFCFGYHAARTEDARADMLARLRPRTTMTPFFDQDEYWDKIDKHGRWEEFR